jgi:hypothetical protein
MADRAPAIGKIAMENAKKSAMMVFISRKGGGSGSTG